MPKIFIAWMIVCMFVGIMSLTFVVSKCGAKGLLFGSAAFGVAATGMCDEK